MKTLEEFHECGNSKLDYELENVAHSYTQDYLVEIATPVEFTKPMFSTNIRY
jgi:hypothetical protein